MFDSWTSRLADPFNKTVCQYITNLCAVTRAGGANETNINSSSRWSDTAELKRFRASGSMLTHSYLSQVVFLRKLLLLVDTSERLSTPRTWQGSGQEFSLVMVKWEAGCRQCGGKSVMMREALASAGGGGGGRRRGRGRGGEGGRGGGAGFFSTFSTSSHSAHWNVWQSLRKDLQCHF